MVGSQYSSWFSFLFSFNWYEKLPRIIDTNDIQMLWKIVNPERQWARNPSVLSQREFITKAIISFQNSFSFAATTTTWNVHTSMQKIVKKTPYRNIYVLTCRERLYFCVRSNELRINNKSNQMPLTFPRVLHVVIYTRKSIEHFNLQRYFFNFRCNKMSVVKVNETRW